MSDQPKDPFRKVTGRFSEEKANAIANERAAAEEYDPNRLLDALLTKMQLDNDAALAYKLQVIHPIVRMIREEKLAMNPLMLLLWIQEATGITLEELRDLMKKGQPGG